jgi:hypothetical protein
MSAIEHGLFDAFSLLKAKALKGAELFETSERLTLLFLMLLFNRAGVPLSTIRKSLVLHSRFQRFLGATGPAIRVSQEPDPRGPAPDQQKEKET